MPVPRANLLWLAACACAPGASGWPGPDIGRLPPRFDAEQPMSGQNDWEPHVAADPGSDWVYQIATRLQRDTSHALFRASSDGGATWGADQLLGEGDDLQYDPQVAVARDSGCVFATWLHPEEPWTTFLVRSCDNGAHWTDPVSVAPEGASTDHGMLAVSASGEDVYVGYIAILAGDGSGADGEDEALTDAFVAVSHDGGAGFSSPWSISCEPDCYWWQTAAAVGPTGDIWFAATRYSADYSGDTTVAVWRSNDGGARFDVAELDRSAEAPACGWDPSCPAGFLTTQAGLAVDDDGAVLVAYHAGDLPGEPQALWVRRSPGGADWRSFSDRIALSHRGADNAFPAVASAPGSAGDFRVLWQANGQGQPTAWNSWYQQTDDGGESWLQDAVRLSDATAGATYQTADGYGFPYGDYLGLSVDGQGKAHTIWGESGRYDGPGGAWFTRQR